MYIRIFAHTYTQHLQCINMKNTMYRNYNIYIVYILYKTDMVCTKDDAYTSTKGCSEQVHGLILASPGTRNSSLRFRCC